MSEINTLEALRTLLDPRVVAKWLDEVEGHRAAVMKVEGATASSPVGDPERLLTVDELAERLGVKTSWIYDKTSRDAIPHVRVGRYIRFRWEEVERWLNDA